MSLWEVTTRIYVIKCNATGRHYVGRTCGKVEERFIQHLTLLRRGAHGVEVMQDDFNKYGEESFTVHEFASYSDIREETTDAHRMEAFLQILLRTKEPEYGYNYKDTCGTSERAAFEKWRTDPRYWFKPLKKGEKIVYSACQSRPG